MGNFINDALGFFGLNDNEVKISANKQSQEKITNVYRDESFQRNQILEKKGIKQIPISSTPNFDNGSINVTVNGTFNIATKDGNFNMREFAAAIQKSIFDALRKKEQNKINTTIYG